MTKFTFIDLFAGIGGFRQGLEKNGGECIGFSEIEKTAIQTYCENYNESVDDNFGDITKIKTLPPHDILTGGVPCQSWSIAGKNLGFDDDRGQLWNDTIFLLQQSKPKAFIFENVKGLQDPRNHQALSYILSRIEQAGYFAKHFLLNTYEYGLPQNRQRVYIIGFHKKEYLDQFILPSFYQNKKELGEFLGYENTIAQQYQTSLFGQTLKTKTAFNDFFLFNDIRNGDTTIHSWDIFETTQKEKDICNFLLKNRRKQKYGPLDGNPLAYHHFSEWNSSIKIDDLEKLVEKNILRKIDYSYKIINSDIELSENEKIVISCSVNNLLEITQLKNNKELLKKKINWENTIESLKEKNLLMIEESRFDFKNSKISSGINGVNRIYLPSSDVYSTLVASDTNDFIATKNITAKTIKEYKEKFLQEIYWTESYRKITKEEACTLQGFPKDFILPTQRAKWMKLLGNSVSIPVIDNLVQAMLKTGLKDEL